MRALALLVLLATLACGSSSSPARVGLAPPVKSPLAPTTNLAPETYTLTVVGNDSLTAAVGSFCGPLAVLVTDQAGNHPDGVNVVFTPAVPLWGPYGLGSTLSGDDQWTVSVAGSGVAAVGCVPAVVGVAQVTATVAPRVASIPQGLASSNQVTFQVEGR